MQSLRRRLAELESRSMAGGVLRWHRVIQAVGQNQEDAIAAYEADNGPIGPGEGAILRVLVSAPPAFSERSPCLH